MKSALFGIGIVVVSFVAAIVAASAAWVFWDAWKASDRDAFRALVGAFSGAFFAYVFVRFADGFKKVYDRKEKNHTALVRLQHYINDCLNITSDNLFIADDCVKVFNEQRLQAGELSIYMNVFHEYPIDRELLIGLTNIKFLNEVYSLNVEFSKLNDSMATVDRAYAQVRDAFVAKHFDEAVYLLNARRTRERCVELRGYLLQTKQELIRLFAVTNLLLRDPPFLVRVIRSLTQTAYPKDFDAALGPEVARVTSEMEGIAQASAQRILAAQNSVAQPPGAADAAKAPRR
ncbi:MAG TPA: hypothetical protein VHE58_10340 [Burkholderiales bacterium]|nr:hypothetical protein [Burkholderiales bacterium]